MEEKSYQQTIAKTVLLDKYEDDIKLSKLNELKIMTQWRKIMRLAKNESLKKEIKILAEEQERNLQRKDGIIQFLLRDLEESELRIVETSESLVKDTNAMMSIHSENKNTLEYSYKENIHTLESKFRDDMASLEAVFDEELKDAHNVEQTVIKEIEQSQAVLERSFQRQDEDYQRVQREEMESMRSRLEEQIESLKSQMENTSATHQSEFGAVADEYNEMLITDKSLTEVLSTRKKQVDNLQMLLFQWQGKMKQLIGDSEERKRVLISEKRNMHNHYQALKTRIKAYRALLTQRLTELSSRAYECKKRLHAKLAVGKRVLAAAKAAQDWHEGEEGDVTAWRTDLEDETDLESTSTFKATSSSGSGGKDMFTSSADNLNKFYGRYNKLLAQAALSEATKNRLRDENKELQELLSQYEKASTFSPDSVQGCNFLLIVNGRSNIDSNLLHLTGSPMTSKTQSHTRHK